MIDSMIHVVGIIAAIILLILVPFLWLFDAAVFPDERPSLKSYYAEAWDILKEGAV